MSSALLKVLDLLESTESLSNAPNILQAVPQQVVPRMAALVTNAKMGGSSTTRETKEIIMRKLVAHATT